MFCLFTVKEKKGLKIDCSVTLFKYFYMFYVLCENILREMGMKLGACFPFDLALF